MNGYAPISLTDAGGYEISVNALDIDWVRNLATGEDGRNLRQIFKKSASQDSLLVREPKAEIDSLAEAATARWAALVDSKKEKDDKGFVLLGNNITVLYGDVASLERVSPSQSVVHFEKGTRAETVYGSSLAVDVNIATVTNQLNQGRKPV